MTEGLLSEAQTRVYDALFRFGPCTAAELAKRSLIAGSWKRLSELKRLSCAAEVGVKTCSVTGSHALVWDVTAKLPEPPTGNEETPKDKIRRLERTVRRQDRKIVVYRDLVRQLHRLLTANDLDEGAGQREASRLVLQTHLQLEQEGLGE
jgi:hypothetical protein